jgi:hypothetical protein
MGFLLNRAPDGKQSTTVSKLPTTMSIRRNAVWVYLANMPFFRNFTLNMGLFCIVILLNVLSNGFDLGVYNVIQAMDGECRRLQCSQAQ